MSPVSLSFIAINLISLSLLSPHICKGPTYSVHSYVLVEQVLLRRSEGGGVLKQVPKRTDTRRDAAAGKGCCSKPRAQRTATTDIDRRPPPPPPARQARGRDGRRETRRGAPAVYSGPACTSTVRTQAALRC